MYLLSLLMALLTKFSPSAVVLLPSEEVVTQLADMCPSETIAPC